MTLKEKMKKGPVFGMACFTGTTCVIENIAMSGLDFIYLDLEHTNYMLDEAFEKQIMAAKLHDISVLVRMADDNEVAIRKVLEWGADGVVIPHCKTAEMARRSVEGAKFAPLGRRGGETNVRAAGFGYHNFDWNAYIEQQNRDTLVIPMDEDFEFTDNIDEILTVAVCLGLYLYYRRENRRIRNSSTMLTAECKSTLVDGSMSFGIGVVAVFLWFLPAGGPLDFLHYTGDFFITVALVLLTIKEPFGVLKDAFVELVGGVHDDDATNAFVESAAQRHLPQNTDYEQVLVFKTGMNYTVDVYLSGIGQSIDVEDLVECKRDLEKELTKRLHIVDVDFVFD